MKKIIKEWLPYVREPLDYEKQAGEQNNHKGNMREG